MQPQCNGGGGKYRCEMMSKLPRGILVLVSLAMIITGCGGTDRQPADTQAPSSVSGLAKTSEPTGDISSLMKSDPTTVDPIDTSGERAEAAPLVQAAADGDLEGVLFLLSDGEDPNLAHQRDGWTPLMSAAFYGHIEVAEALIEAGANLDRGTDDEWTPLMGASQNGHVEIVKLLLASGANSRVGRSSNWTALHSAVFNGHEEISRLLLEADTPYEAAEKGFTPLALAAQEGQDAIIQLLLNFEADVDGHPGGPSPVAIATQNGHFSSLELLLAPGADPDLARDGFPPIVIAAQRGAAEAINILAAAGANLNLGQSSDGVTALHWAAYNGDETLVILLLELGADRTVQDNHGRYPRDIAVERGYLGIAELLALSGSS
jgi:ankyrin repeat protein